jgi:GGDEF domain-containing protein
MYGEKAGGDVALRVFADHMRKFGFRDIDILANPGGDEFFVILTNTEMDIPDYKMDTSKPVDAFKASCSEAQNMWLKVEKFMQDGRIIPFEGVDKHGEPFTDIMRARITCEQYGDSKENKSSLNDAITKSELPTTLLKRFTKDYVIGGR